MTTHLYILSLSLSLCIYIYNVCDLEEGREGIESPPPLAKEMRMATSTLKEMTDEHPSLYSLSLFLFLSLSLSLSLSIYIFIYIEIYTQMYMHIVFGERKRE